MNVTPIDPLDRLSPTFKADLNRLFSEQIPALSAELRAIIEAGSFGTELLGFRNKVIGDFGQDQRGKTSVADDEYCCDRWYALTETGSVTVGQVVDPEQGAPWAWKLTQPDVVAKRIGLATIIESKNIRAYRGQAMNLSMRVKPSFSGAVRYAIIEHTGTADVVTSDVVNNWSSSVFTAGNFFIAGLNIIKTGTVTPGANLYDWIDDHGIFGASMNNAILFVWSESAQIQGATLELNRPQFEPGIIKTPREWRLDELQLCQRYYEKTHDENIAPGSISSAGALMSFTDGFTAIANRTSSLTWQFKVKKMRAPAVNTYSPSRPEQGLVRMTADDYVSSVSNIGAGSCRISGTDLATTSASYLLFQATADAEL